MAQGGHIIFDDNGQTDIITASGIEIIVGSDDSKNKGAGTVTVKYRQHSDAEWATIKTFDTADAIEDFKANSDKNGQYQIFLAGATSPDLQVSWSI